VHGLLWSVTRFARSTFAETSSKALARLTSDMAAAGLKMRFSKIRAIVALLTALAIFPSVSKAEVAPTSVGPIQLVIPEGFEYVTSEEKENLKTSAWTKGAGLVRTLLQVSIFDMGSAAASATPAELAQGAEKYLHQFLEGVQDHRTDYTLSPVRHLSIAGEPAASASWTGNASGIGAVGVMYCVIIQARYIISFHTQDIGNAPTPAMREAMKSFEGAKVSQLSDLSRRGSDAVGH
jgi:hypothetical protein